MEDDEDIVLTSPSLEQSLQPEVEELHQRDAVSTAVDSTEIDSVVEDAAVAPPSLAEVDERENEVKESKLEKIEDVIVSDDVSMSSKVEVRDELVAGEVSEREVSEFGGDNVKESKLERDEDVIVDGEGLLLPEVEVRDELKAIDVAESEVREFGAEDVEESKLEREEVDVREVESKSVGKDVEESKLGSEKEVTATEGEGIEAAGSENEVKNVEEPSEERDEQVGVTASEVEDKLLGECVEADEEIDVRNEVAEVKGVEEEEVKMGKEEIVEKDTEMDVEEDTSIVKEVEGDRVVIAEKVPSVNEGIDGEEEEDSSNAKEVIVSEKVPILNDDMGGEERETTVTVKEVEGGEAMNVGESIEKDEEMGGEEKEDVLRANEAEGDWVLKAEDVPPVNMEVQMVDEKPKEVNTDQLDEDRAANEVEEEGEEKKVPEEASKEEEEKVGEGMDHSLNVTKNNELMAEEGTPFSENDMEMEVDTMKSGSGSGSGGKGKRGRNVKPASAVKAPSRKLVGEDVCFICLDGGDLVLCDRRGCPKAYHPTCVDHDAEFFKTKGRWNCGWHLCNQCGKNAYFMCYTCQFSLCKACSKDAAIFCVRRNKGFCESCMKTIGVIENSEQNEMGQDAFSDKSSWEYLFKDYWLEQKDKLCITSDELSQAKNPWKDSDKQQPSLHEGNDDAGSDSDGSLGNSELTDSERKKAKKSSKSVGYDSNSSSEKNANSGKRKSKRRLKSQAKKTNSDSEDSSPDTSTRRGKKARRLLKSRSKGVKYAEDNSDWASKELLEFVMLMKHGNRSVLTKFDVQGLLLEYIKRNKLRDPRRKSQIICDSILQKLFGKARVGHFEMLKLLESHFFLKDADDNQGSVADSEMRQLDTDDNTDSQFDGGKSRGKKSRKREEKGYQSNLDDYAAIDMHNINLIFLRRNLLEALLQNSETFHDKVVGAFVRIKISGSNKQDTYRLVQITGTSKAAEPYKVGKRTTDIVLEILNLDKKETISIDTMSNQEFSEDECKRLRQSIKCGLINRMTVGDIVEEARELQEVRVLDWLEAETVRLSHLRDRASEKGRKKELRECVEKLQLLKTPEERQRRLDEIAEVHADPKMDPSYESDDEMDITRQGSDTSPRETGLSRRGRGNFASRKGGLTSSSNSWSANARPPSQKWEPNRSTSGKDFSGRKEDSVFTSPTRDSPWSNGVDKSSPRFNTRESPGLISESMIPAEHSGVRSNITAVVSESPCISSVAGLTGLKFDETEKMWHYRDPAGKVQGPFSINQLRKWSNTGYFPTDLRVWRISQTENDAILLTDILAGRLDKEVPSVNNVPSSLDTSKLSGNARSSGGRYESSNIPSPTPARGSFQSSNQLRGEIESANISSSTPTRSSFQSSNQLRGIERLPSPTPTSPNPIGKSNFSHQLRRGVSRNSGENLASSVVQQTVGQQSSTSGPRSDLSSSPGFTNGRQILSQSNVQMGATPYTAPNSMTNQPNAVTGQNPSVYAHNWSSNYVAGPETVNPSMTQNNPNVVSGQAAYGQWAGYAGVGNTATNMASLSAQNAWRHASANMAWSGQQQQMVNPNIVWAGQPTVPAAGMGQQTGSTPGGIPTMNWSGTGTNPSAGNVNPGWVAPPGNPGGWGSR